jgi:hypothetical protein
MTAIILPQTEKERAMVQACLPAAMFELLFTSLLNDGYDVRLDMKEYAGKASVAPLMQEPPLDPFTVKRLAERVQKDGYDILKNAGTDDPRFLVGGLARYLVRMKADGIDLSQDTTIIALGICAEMDDGVEDWGKKLVVDRIAGRLEKNFREKGYMFKLVTLEAQPG